MKFQIILLNNQFHHNFSASWGGAIYCKSSDLSLIGEVLLVIMLI